VSTAYNTGLDKNSANFAALSPIPFVEWAAQAAPDHPAVIHGARRYSWAETYARCRRLASALVQRGIGPGDTVAVMLSNTPEMYECHFGVPMTGAVLNCLNTRLDAPASRSSSTTAKRKSSSPIANSPRPCRPRSRPRR
jgi:fatty-acyl-CoA synthase